MAGQVEEWWTAKRIKPMADVEPHETQGEPEVSVDAYGMGYGLIPGDGVRVVPISEVVFVRDYNPERGHQVLDVRGGPINVGPGFTPSGTQLSNYEFFSSMKHTKPVLRTRRCGARMLEHKATPTATPVSGCTLHGFNGCYNVPVVVVAALAARMLRLDRGYGGAVGFIAAFTPGITICTVCM